MLICFQDSSHSSVSRPHFMITNHLSYNSVPTVSELFFFFCKMNTRKENTKRDLDRMETYAQKKEKTDKVEYKYCAEEI